ncbi:hypothetical protein [Chitinophaga qingshengii]|uniref:Uncharacterized protein n=1 Tax=Chitinophaga qingshengii TaxID=1569794 RepID=A0ABR7TX53_9BACT|nr:hypothetical protein [Chitinophaga qingshengii]MBC9934255.1 hypothetical protein [Chitinophaga qingshengii]
MKNCLRLLLLCSCLLLVYPTYAGGLSAWEKSTPGGNKMEWDGTAPARALFWGVQCDSLKDPVPLATWYFYKDCIIGGDDSTFYVINEPDCSVHRFTEKSAFEAYLTAQNLVPRVWKRTYNAYDIWDYSDRLLFMSFFLIPVLGIVLICYIVVLVGLLRGKKRAVWKYVFLAAPPLVYIIAAILQASPQSW